jgi:hypothetical protein
VQLRNELEAAIDLSQQSREQWIHEGLELGIEDIMEDFLPLLHLDLGKIRQSDESGHMGREVAEWLRGKLHKLVLCLESKVRVIEALVEKLYYFRGSRTMACLKTTVYNSVSFSACATLDVRLLGAVGVEMVMIDFEVVLHMPRPLAEARVNAVIWLWGVRELG